MCTEDGTSCAVVVVETNSTRMRSGRRQSSSAARERSELRTRSPAGANCKRRNCCTSDSLTFCDGADAAGVGDANAVVVVVVVAVVDVVVAAAAVAVVVDKRRIDLSAVGELRQLQQLQTAGLIDAMLRPAININITLQ